MSEELGNTQQKTIQALEVTADNAKSVTEVRAMLQRDEKDKIRQNFQNCMIVFQFDPLLQGAIRYNNLTDRIDIVKNLGWKKTSSTLTDTDKNYILLYMEEKYGITNEKRIEKAISIIANENRYHPIVDYLNGLVWDKKERMRYMLHHFFGAEVNEHMYEFIKLFLLGAISRVFEPGCKYEYILCLVGGQGAGKSSFFQFLALKDEWFSDDLKKIDDENVYRKLQGHWIIEMAEMIATANAKSIEEIKGFASRRSETYKVPYETHPADRPRQCVFGGTSNTMDFLPLDRSGNRRFIPVLVQMEEAEVHIRENEAESRAYIEQVWAEAMEIYRSKDFKLKLPPETDKFLKEYQKAFMPEDTKVGIIQSFLDNYSKDIICSKLIYAEALKHPFDEPKQRDLRDINDIMNLSIKGWKYFSNPRNFGGDIGRQKGWERDNPLSTTKANSDDFIQITEQMEIPFD